MVHTPPGPGLSDLISASRNLLKSGLWNSFPSLQQDVVAPASPQHGAKVPLE